jgi:hypothetical protein
MAEQIVTTSTSPKTLGTADFLKGLLLAVGMAVLTVVENSIQAGSLKLDWKNIGLIAVGTAVTYLLKNLFTAPQTTITPPPGAAAGSTVTVQIPAPGQKITQTVDVKPAP